MTSSKKAQSAMEYLMTYGWAIILIAVVITVLYALGLFNQGGGSSCVALSGYECSQAVYSHSQANILATVGQITGVNWGPTNIFYVPDGSSPGTNVVGVPGWPNGENAANSASEVVRLSGGFLTGEAIQINLPVLYVTNGMDIANVPVGAQISGSIWAEYTQNGNTYYVPMATLDLKAQ